MDGVLDPRLFALLAVILAGGKLAGSLVARRRLPPLLGELLVGVALGNLGLLGWHDVEPLLRHPGIALLAELGVLVLLFQVGLESELAQMLRVGPVALLVAVVGVLVPLGLGYGVHAAMVPAATWPAHLFIGAVLTATSIGVTARVFKDLGHVATPTARIVIGAAVIDDVLGLIVLAVVSDIVRGAGTRASVDALSILLVVGKAVGFLGGAILLGRPASRALFELASRLRGGGVLVAAALAFAFALAFLAHEVGLAPIVGAFAAGLVLEAPRQERHLEDQLTPLGELLTPIFFVYTGSQVDLHALGHGSSLALAGALTAAAVVAKLACALVAFGPGVNRLAVGIGMIPRGEVGLIFASKGAVLLLAGAPVLGPEVFAAVIAMVMATTMLTPPLLAWSLRRTTS